MQRRLVQEISVRHTLELFDGNIGLLFYPKSVIRKYVFPWLCL